MVKPASDVKSIIEEYASALGGKIHLQKILMTEAGAGPGDIHLLVFSDSFDGLDRATRSDLLAKIAADVSPYIQAWGFTPQKLASQQTGKVHDALLGMMLHGSREVFPRAA